MTLLEKIERLLNDHMGDSSRLEHIRKSIVENKKIYNSDIQYVEELDTKRTEVLNVSDERHPDNSITCWKCGKVLVQNSKFCSFCGVRLDKTGSKSVQGLSRITQEYNSLKILSNFHSYQILAVIGGLAGMIPILIATSNIDRVLDVIAFYTGRDLSGFVDWFRALGILSAGLCFFAITASFIIKKSKKSGRILFFLSIAILISSLMVGVAGFVILLSAAIMALKKRRY